MKKVQLRDAKAKLSAIVEEALNGKPAVITRHGKKEAVIISYEEWDRLNRVPSFARLLMAIPGDLPVERDATPPRNADL